jgi:hypothetical protein
MPEVESDSTSPRLPRHFEARSEGVLAARIRLRGSVLTIPSLRDGDRPSRPLYGAFPLSC